MKIFKLRIFAVTVSNNSINILIHLYGNITITDMCSRSSVSVQGTLFFMFGSIVGINPVYSKMPTFLTNNSSKIYRQRRLEFLEQYENMQSTIHLKWCNTEPCVFP